MDLILREDKDILVAYKKPGMATQSSNIRSEDLYSALMKYLKGKGVQKPEIHLINRIDQNVSGLVLCALNKKAAAVLSRDLQKGWITKRYKATVMREPKDREGTLRDRIYFDKKENKSYVVREDDPRFPEGKPSELRFKVIGKNLLDIELITGRHHQIRCQLGHIGCPIMGDYKYASPEIIKEFDQSRLNGIALCAYHLEFNHPVTGEKKIIEI
ncbi:MAG: RluA family pseudouridine synthase [Lachnospiraceae bacterium]|nr:RluA family pseudouridine synthase [Lachnospiraceae bacterium]